MLNLGYVYQTNAQTPSAIAHATTTLRRSRNHIRFSRSTLTLCGWEAYYEAASIKAYITVMIYGYSIFAHMYITRVSWQKHHHKMHCEK